MTNELQLTIARHIKAPPRVVWDAWTRPEQLARWWIPAPMECRVLTLDVHPGGGLRTEMREPGGEFGPHLDACFLDVLPGERLVWTTVLRAGWQPVEPWLALTAIITLTPEDGGTRYAAEVLHRSGEEARRHAEMHFADGWGTVLEQLAALIE